MLNVSQGIEGRRKLNNAQKRRRTSSRTASKEIENQLAVIEQGRQHNQGAPVRIVRGNGLPVKGAPATNAVTVVALHFWHFASRDEPVLSQPAVN